MSDEIKRRLCDSSWDEKIAHTVCTRVRRRRKKMIGATGSLIVFLLIVLAGLHTRTSSGADRFINQQIYGIISNAYPDLDIDNDDISMDILAALQKR